jgi:hypothetical protein
MIKFVAVKPNTNPDHFVRIKPGRLPFFNDDVRHPYDAERRRAVVVDWTMREVVGKWLVPGESYAPAHRPDTKAVTFVVRDDVTTQDMVETVQLVRREIWDAMTKDDTAAWMVAVATLKTLV